MIKDIKKIKTIKQLLREAKWLEGKMMKEIVRSIKKSDKKSRVTTKSGVGDVMEEFFDIKRNSDAQPDVAHLGVEIKTCPLKYNTDRTRLGVKEPLSLNIINYINESKNRHISESSLYKKNEKILLIVYIHDKEKERSEYKVKYVFLWEMTPKILEELNDDYLKIIEKIKNGIAHEIHQSDHKKLTICPKHGGTFKDPNCTASKTRQPYSDKPVEVRGFRLKTCFMNKVVSEHYGLKHERGGWLV